jgi:hypothetical protein
MTMSSKSRVYLAVVAVIVAGAVPVGLLTAGASTSATASTTACGSACTSLMVETDGTSDYLTMSGSSVGMAAASTTNSGQDFTLEDDLTVSYAQELAPGFLPSRWGLLYSNGPLVEFQYAPSGKPSGECLGDTSTNNATEETPYNEPTLNLALETCGVTLATLWIVDPNNGPNAAGYDDLINVGYEETYSYMAPTFSDQNTLTSPYADPEVLTLNSSGDVVLAELSEIGGVVSPGQMWAASGSAGLAQVSKAAAAKSAAALRAAGKS